MNSINPSVEGTHEQQPQQGALGLAAGSASGKRYEAAEMAIAYDRLSRHPEIQAEAIANHYSCLATVAIDLRHMIKARHYSGATTADIEAAIAHLKKIITDAHRHDLGIELSWPNRQ